MSNNQICGYVSLLYSVADKPLDLWSKYVSLGGKIHRVRDDALHGDKVLEIIGSHDNSVPTNITAPADILDTLNVKLPVLVLVLKNLNLPFKLEVQIIDEKLYRRKFSFITYNHEKLPSIDINAVRIPLKLEECWNSLEINLQTLCCKVYGINYQALQRIIVYSNCRLRRIYMQDRHYNHDEIPSGICQAFFDMYMLKQGITFVEKSCQTEKYYTESTEQCNLNCFANNNTITASSPRKAVLFRTAYSMGKLGNLNTLDSIVNLCDSNKLEKDHTSLIVGNSEMKIDKCRLKRSNITEKQERQNIAQACKTKNPNSLINIKFHNHTLQPATFTQQERTGSRQFLKTHADGMLKDNIHRFLHSYRIRDSIDTYITVKDYTLSNSNINNVQTEKDNVNVMDIKFGASIVGSPSASRYELPNDIKDNETSEKQV